MAILKIRARRLALLMMSVGIFFGVDAAANESSSAHAQGIVAPYAWAPDMSGSVGLNGISVPLDLQSTELLRGVKSGGMGYLQWPVGDRNFIYLEGFQISFGQKNFQPFFNQTVDADLFMGESGFGWNFPVDTSFPIQGSTVISPYLGARVVNLKVKVKGPLLVQSVGQEWRDPVLGLIIQGPLSERLGYIAKIDVGGFNTGDDNYRSVVAVMRYAFDASWSLALGYRISHFDNRSDSASGVTINLTGSGPIAGITYSF